MQCPACGGATAIERVRCTACSTGVDGRFDFGWPGLLSAEQLGFARVFLEARGKIKDVERALGLSYPTVVARLDEVVNAITAQPQRAPAVPPPQRGQVLDELASGSIDVDEA